MIRFLVIILISLTMISCHVKNYDNMIDNEINLRKILSNYVNRYDIYPLCNFDNPNCYMDKKEFYEMIRKSNRSFAIPYINDFCQKNITLIEKKGECSFLFVYAHPTNIIIEWTNGNDMKYLIGIVVLK